MIVICSNEHICPITCDEEIIRFTVVFSKGKLKSNSVIIGIGKIFNFILRAKR